MRLKSGGLVLSFATRAEGPPSRTTVSKVSGIIVQAPLIRLGYEESQLTLWFVWCASKIAPNLPIPSAAMEEASPICTLR